MKINNGIDPQNTVKNVKDFYSEIVSKFHK